MSQNPFGAPAPGVSPEPAPLPAETVAEKSHKGLLIGGLGGLVALVVAGGAFLVLSGDEDLEPAPLAAAPVPSASSTTTEPSAPLPTLAEFNGRNPFEAKIVEGTGGGGGGGGEAVPAGSSAQPTTAPGGGGTVAGPGGGGGSVVFVPGPTVTKTVPGPETTVTKEVEVEVEVEVPVLVELEPGSIDVVFTGTDVGDPALPDFTVEGVVVPDVVDDPATSEDEAVFAYYFKVLNAALGHTDPTQDQVLLQFGDALRWVTVDVPEVF